ncbi:hypothetical protein BDZ94DRAFT_1312510 [Collybia nuda]|uniref:DUF4219 domain-containing protein n=1 Tax=Collybia nuda TaxID=64659 RepID=A0A9P5XZ89_9AGAR|nr:hypothetical protein BDZ94DRAFT_1312510 [Collybia nuda]
MTFTKPTFPLLNNTNYTSWAANMSAWLRVNGYWRIVKGLARVPSLSSPPTEDQLEAQELYFTKAQDSKNQSKNNSSNLDITEYAVNIKT